MLVTPKFIARCFVALLTSGVLCIRAATELPEGGISILAADPIASHGFWAGNNEGPVGSREVVPVDHPDFDKAIRVTISNPNGVFWNGQVSFSNSKAVDDGDVLMLRLFFRSISTEDETGTSFTTVYPQSPSPNFTKYLTRELTAFEADGWKEYLLPFEMTDSLSAGDLSLLFGIGGGVHSQTWEIGGIELLNYEQSKTVNELPQTRSSYLGREADAPWRHEAAERIERYRKGPIRIHVFDANGNPVPDAEVEVKFLKHAYHFGTAVSAAFIMEDSSEAETFRQKVLELFNQAGPFNAFKWPAWVGDWGTTNFGEEVALGAAQWMKENGLYTRAHVMVWPGESHLPRFMRDYIPDNNPAGTDPAAEQAVLDHIAAIGAASVPYIDEWDVLNEPFDNHDLMDAFGNDIMVDWFNAARAVLPTHPLYLNDYSILSGGGRAVSHQQHYEDTIQFLLDNNAPIDAMGMQGHFNESPTPVPILWDVLERYANAFPGLDIRVTEFTVSSTDEQLQADYLRDFYTLVFSHPRTVGIQLWGFYDEQPDENSPALFRPDWTPKPNGQAFIDLVHGDWWNDFNGTTSDRGVFDRRGFYGDYKATATMNGEASEMEFTLQKEGANQFSLILPNAQTGKVHIQNGNFETGNTSGWTINAADEFELAPNVEFAGPGFYFPIEPTAGDAALTLGIRGQEIGTIEVAQLIEVPDIDNITLSFDYRGIAELLNTFQGTPFDLHIERENGEAAMTPLAVYHPSTSADNPDTGNRRRRVNLENFRGETLRIRFTLTNNGSGENNYTYVMLDNVVLAPYSPPSLRAEVEDGTVNLHLAASDDSPYELESSADLEVWAQEATVEDLDLEGRLPHVDESFSGGKKFYRLREL